MGGLDTVEDMRKLGKQLAVAFRMSDANRNAASTFDMWQRHRVDEIGELVESDDIERVTEGVILLGELRSHRAVPYLKRAARLSHPAVTGNQSPEEILFDRITTALFRTECLGGHKEIHRVWKYQNSKWHHGLRNLLVEAYQGSKSNIGWYAWLNFTSDYRTAERLSDRGCDAFNRQHYLDALQFYSDAVNTYPFFSGFWRQMGDAKVRLSKEGSDADIEGFREWWGDSDRRDEQRDRILWGSYTDHKVAAELAPYLPGDLADIGYGCAMADNHLEAEKVYDRALSLQPSTDQKAYIFLRRGETHEALDEPTAALRDYQESIKHHELMLPLERSGSVLRVNAPYNIEEMVKDLQARVERLKE
ncbi:MAG: hypothetical protein V1740_05260 [Candidatus Woesearchaeota archaeon]